jgi:hypothetical protein
VRSRSSRTIPGPVGQVSGFTWILDKLGVGFAITLNRGQPLGIEVGAPNLAQLAVTPRPNRDDYSKQRADPGWVPGRTNGATSVHPIDRAP